MKRFLLLFCLLATVLSGFSQVSIGNYTMFPNKKMKGSYYKPQIAFAKLNNDYALSLRTCNPNDYYMFDADSRLLVKYADGTTEKFAMNEKYGVHKDYDNTSLYSAIIHFYKTFTLYEVSSEFIEKVIKNKQNIIKIRIGFSNGDVEDFDIDEKYQPTLVSGLVESYNSVNQQNDIRKKNKSDEDF